MFEPIDSDFSTRYSGIPTFFRLPVANENAAIDVGVFGIPWDGGVTDRPGACLGPRHVRVASAYARQEHGVLGVRPFEACAIADLGDVFVNPVNRDASLLSVRQKVEALRAKRIAPLAVGGDHLCTLPILEGFRKEAPIGLIQFDAHVDTWDVDFANERLTHGTPFRRAIESGFVDPKRMIQIGIREMIHSRADLAFGRANGITCITVEELRRRGIQDTAHFIGETMRGAEVYVSIDIDVLDPAFAPGTGTPEVGGLTTMELMQLVRGLTTLRILGGDVVEVSPPFDSSGITALAAATVLYELLCAIVVGRSNEIVQNR